MTNIGSGRLEVSGNPQAGRRAARASSGEAPSAFGRSPVEPVQVTFESADSHDHFHLMRAMRYSLWNLERTAQVAPGQKVGFCLYDTSRSPPRRRRRTPRSTRRRVTHYCEQGNPASTSLRMGVSSGWRDVYDQSLAYQWIDVSNTAPGRYLVGAEADPDNTLWEGGGGAEGNVPAFDLPDGVTVPGWTAQPVSLAQTGAAQAVPLSAQKFGTQASNLRYRVTSAPGARHAQRQPVGQDFAGTQLVYTPPRATRAGTASPTSPARARSALPRDPPARR